MNTKIINLLPQFIKDLNRLQPEYSSADRIWQLPMRTGKRPKDWALTHVTHYQDTYYLSSTLNRLQLEISEKGEDKNSGLEKLFSTDSRKFSWALGYFHRQIDRINKDWAGVYRETLRDYPLAMRYGTVPKRIIWEYYPDLYRADSQLKKKEVSEFIDLARAYKFHEEYGGHHEKMSLGLFMRYCKTAYLANAEEFKGGITEDLSGLEMYKRYADGRHEGLTELPLKSTDAFDKWYRSKRGGGHPWEIYRGGNTTHISLGVIERNERWSVYLSGSSTMRMVETIRIALALSKAGLPIEVSGAEAFVLRLLGMDNLGIIPDYRMNHRAAQDFSEEDKVFDCLHLYDLPRNNRILPFTTWKPIAPLLPLRRH